MALQHLRSGTANKRPIPTVMSSGQIAINTNEASPGLFFKDSNGDLVKVGPVHIGTDAPNSSPASTAATALVAGTTYQILTVGDTDFTLVGASSNTVGVIFTATGAGTGTGTVSGQQGVEKGEQWLDTTGGSYVLKIYDGTAWRSESGTFVDVNGDTMTGALLLDNAASASAPDLSFDGDADTGIYSPGADQLAIATGGTAAVTVDASQNVGIGATAPDDYLSGADKLVIASSSAGTGLTIATPTTSAGTIAFADGTGAADNARGIVRYSHSDNSMQFFTNATTSMIIDSDGRLLVGATSSSSDVNTVFQGSSTSNLCRVFLSNTAATSILSADNVLGNLSFRSSDENEYASIQGVVDAATGVSDYPGRLVFSTTADGDPSPTERMRIDSSGVVTTTGTAVLASPLTDRGLKVSSTAGPASGTGGAVVTLDAQANTYDGAIILAINGSEHLRIDGDGRLLAGLSSTSLNANAVFEGASGGATGAARMFFQRGSQPADGQSLANFFFTDNSGNQGAQIDAIRDGGAWTSGSSHPTRLQFRTTADGDPSPTERMRIDSDGNVGINATNPLAQLHIINPSATNGLYISRANGSSLGDQISLRFSTDSTKSRIYGYGDAMTFWTAATSATASERMRIDSSGNVGIGTILPDQLLHLESSSSFLAISNSGDTGDAGILFRRTDNNENRGYVLYDFTNDALKFRTSTNGAGEVMRIDSDGRLLLGLTSQTDSNSITIQGNSGNNLGPAYVTCRRGATSPLTGNGLGYFRFENSDGDLGAQIRAEVTANWSTANDEYPTALCFHTRNASDTSTVERMRIGSDNKVYFGSQASAATAGYIEKATSGNFEFDIVASTSTSANRAIRFFSRSNNESMRIDTSGNVLVGKTASNFATAGIELRPSGEITLTRAGDLLTTRRVSTEGTHLSFRNISGTIVGSVVTTSSSTSYNESSDYRLKENVVDITDGIARIKQLQPRRFNFISDADTTIDGFIAHEAQAVVPEAVTGTHNEVDEDGNAVMQGIDKAKLVPLLTAALQEAIAKIETLEAKVAALEAG